jgi:hypothetical protein
MKPVVFWSLMGVGLLAVAVVAHVCPEYREFGRHPHSAERLPEATMKAISTAQADFRTNRRNGNPLPRFWRADIAGLYALAPGGGPAIKLIELSIAAADERPRTDLTSLAVRAPKAGYWYRSIRHANEDAQALDPNRFAYCAFPDTESAGRYIYVVDERRQVYCAEANGRRGIEVFPTDEELKRRWSKVD